jgi:hypothetical protein
MDLSAVILTSALAVALALHIFHYVIEFLFYYEFLLYYERLFNWASSLVLFTKNMPVLLWFACAIVNAANALISSRHACPNASEMVINPDIAGLGIRVSLYIAQIITLLCLLLGQLHIEPGGIKELGIAQSVCKSFDRGFYCNLRLIIGSHAIPALEHLQRSTGSRVSRPRNCDNVY